MGLEATTGAADVGYYDPTSECPDIAPKLPMGLEEVIFTGPLILNMNLQLNRL